MDSGHDGRCAGRRLALFAALVCGCGAPGAPGTPGDARGPADADPRDAATSDAATSDAAMSGAGDAATPDAGAPDGGPVSPAAPAVMFPPPRSLTTASEITVRGVAPAGTAAVRVGGVAAVTTNGYADWQATVPLQPGDNTPAVEIEDAAGAVEVLDALAVVRDPAQLSDPRYIAVDQVRHRAHVVTGAGAERALWAIDLEPGPGSGQASVIAGAQVGSGPVVVSWGPIAVDALHDRVVVVDLLLRQLMTVRLDTLERGVLSPNDGSHGTPITQACGMAVDAQNERALITNPAAGVILAVDLNDGQRVVLSGAGVGVGPALVEPCDVVVDQAGNRALVMICTPDSEVSTECSIMEVDLSTGNRRVMATSTTIHDGYALGIDGASGRLLVTTLSEEYYWTVTSISLTTGDVADLANPLIGAGHPLHWPIAVGTDAQSGRVLVLDSVQEAVFAIDPATGDRQVAFGYFIGDGVSLREQRALALAPSRQAMFSAVDFYDHPGVVARVQLAAEAGAAVGDRKRVSSNYTHPGTVLSDMAGAVVDDQAGRLLVVQEDAFDTVVAVDLATGDRTTLAGATVGTVNLQSNPRGAAMDGPGALLLVNHSLSYPRVASVDLATGTISVIATAADGLPPLPQAIDVDAAARRAWVGHHDGVISTVDLTSGDAAIVSGPGAGAGPLLYEVFAVAADPARGRLIALAQTSPSILSMSVYAIDIGSGDRTELASRTLGGGPDFRTPGVDLVYDGDADVAWVAESRRGLEAVDVRTGDRVTVSR